MKRGSIETSATAAEQVRQRAKTGTPPSAQPAAAIGPARLIPTGSTLLNLALTGRADGGWLLGRISNLIGDSSSGKTLAALTMFAECARLKRFDRYRLIHDDIEGGNEFDCARLFGARAAARIEPPARDKDGEPLPSESVEDFECTLLRLFKAGRPFLYVLDSLDALTSGEDAAEIKKREKAAAKGEQAAGSYNMGKAKAMSTLLRRVKKGLRDTDSALLIISQTRDNIDPFSFQKKTRSGGRALEFYSSQIVWLAMAGRRTKEVGGVKRAVGVNTVAKVTKNRANGRLRDDFGFPIFYDYGIDDVGSLVDFMIEDGGWEVPKGKQLVPARELGLKMTRERLIDAVEERGLEPTLRAAAAAAWERIEEGMKLGRKPRYE